jgi:endonuclease/exonuclease/phosphatase (EEP) superfamily protein YafD
MGFLGRWSWFFDLFAHFRVQYVVSLLLLCITLVVARRRKAAGVLAVFACVNLFLIAPFYFDGRQLATDHSSVLRAMQLNVNTRLGSPEQVEQAIRLEDPQLVVLEEVSARWMTELEWLKESHPHHVSLAREDNFGIALFSKFPLVDSKVLNIGTAGVPSILATVQTSEGMLRVIATHPLPPMGSRYSRLRNEQLERLADYIDSSRPTLLIGDLNATPWSYPFRRLLKRSGLQDSGRGYGIQPTWPNFNPLLRIPIDHCLHSPDIVITSRRVGEDVASDHYPLIIDFAVVPPK